MWPRNAIAGVATDGRDMPLDDVIIENIEFKTFGELSRGEGVGN